MTTQRSIATAAGVLFLMGAASAANADTLSGGFTINVTNTAGTAPTISTPGTPRLGSITGSNGNYSDLFSGLSLNLNGAATTVNFVTINPQPGGESNTYCGASCETWGGVAASVSQATILAAFNGLTLDSLYTFSVQDGSANSDSGTFYADYTSAAGNHNTHYRISGNNYRTNSGLGSVCTTTTSGPYTDCVNWGSSIDSDASLYFDAASATESYVLEVDLSHAEDWSITPTVTFTLTGTPLPPHQNVPEPASILLFASGLVGLPVLRRRNARKAAKAA
jgi:hypothetical protein